jgi:hypothetical protein
MYHKICMNFIVTLDSRTERNSTLEGGECSVHAAASLSRAIRQEN